MADSFSLKAILSADGSQMSSTFNQISGQVGGLQKKLMGLLLIILSHFLLTLNL